MFLALYQENIKELALNVGKSFSAKNPADTANKVFFFFFLIKCHLDEGLRETKRARERKSAFFFSLLGTDERRAAAI